MSGVQPRGGPGRDVDEQIQEPAHAEVADRRAEQHRGRRRRGEPGEVELAARGEQQVRFLAGAQPVIAELGFRLGRVQLEVGRAAAARRGLIPDDVALGEIERPAQLPGLPDRPGHGHRGEPDPVGQLVAQGQGVATGPVPLVDERDHGDSPVPADVEQLQRLRLEAFGRVQEHDRGVHRREHPVSVLGEVGVPGGVQQVDHGVAVGELQCRGGDGDPAGAFHLHPVRGHPAPAGFAVHRTGFGDHPGVHRQRLGERRFARVRMADDGERPPSPCLAGNVHRTRSSRNT